jgi:hypothetical protein
MSMGLANSSTGAIKDFIYAKNGNAPNFPQRTIIYFDECTGPPYFTGEGHEKWVPIETKKK